MANNSNCAERRLSTALLLFLHLSTIATSALWIFIPVVHAGGLGNQHLWTYDTSEELDVKDVISDKIFAQKGANNLVVIEDEAAKVISKTKIDVVAPGKHLSELMNKISTKSRAKILNCDNENIKQLNIGSVSRPMLNAYLGLELADAKEISSWYEQFKSQRNKIQDSCKSLVSTRKKADSGYSSRDVNLLKEAKEFTDNRLSIAYLVFKNNLNLFMLDSYLLLCTKVESDFMKDRFPDLMLSF